MAIVVLFLLVGCVCSKQQTSNIPANLTQPCPDLPNFQGKDMGDLIGYSVEITRQYKLCQARQRVLAGLQ